MIEATFAWIFLLIGLISHNPDWAIAGGVFAVAANVNAIYRHQRGEDE